MIQTAEFYMKYWKTDRYKTPDPKGNGPDKKSGPFRETVYLTKGRGITTLNMGAKYLA